METHPHWLIGYAGTNSGSRGVLIQGGPYCYPEYVTSGCPQYLYMPVQYANFKYGNKIDVFSRYIADYDGGNSHNNLTARDTANSPATDIVTKERTVRSCYDGRYIYMIYYYVSSTYDLRFAKFDCQTNTWIQKDTVIVSQSGAFPIRVYGVYGSIDIDSNGKLYVNYPLYSSKGYHRLNWAYSTNSGSTWTNAQTMPSTPGSKDSEVPYNIFCVGTNVYHFYTQGTLPYYQKCMCYNGSSWSSESTFQGSIAAAYHFTGRPAIWWTGGSPSSGSELMTIVCTAFDNRYAYSFDSISGSQPSWGNKLAVTNDFIDNNWYYTMEVTTFNDSPYFVYMQYFDWNHWVFYYDEEWRNAMGRARTSYTTWTPVPTGSPVNTSASGFTLQTNDGFDVPFNSSEINAIHDHRASVYKIPGVNSFAHTWSSGSPYYPWVSIYTAAFGEEMPPVEGMGSSQAFIW